LRLAVQHGHYVMQKRLFDLGHGEEDVINFLKVLRRAEMETIDEFIEAHSADERFRAAALQATALLICDNEIERKLYPGPTHTAVWYKRLLNFLQNNPEMAHRDCLNFLTFNYDRSLEHYLHSGITSSGKRFSKTAVEDLLVGNILHLHGHVGKLPWQGGSRDYGVAASPKQLAEIAQGMLAPYQEVTLSSSDAERLIQSDLVVFMGFAFHRQNLIKIQFDQLLNRLDLPLCTTIRALDMDRRDMLERHPRMSIFETDCDNLMSFLGIELEKNKRTGAFKVSEEWLASHRRHKPQ
jgi:hypothetical protein